MKFTRRGCLRAITQGLAGGVIAGSAHETALGGRPESKADSSKLAMPGLYPGRVCAIENPAVLVSGKYQAEEVQKMMRRGMMELTGADGWVDAWRQFFEPGDVVGIKVNPVGQPLVNSDATVVREIIAGLEAAGVKRQDIVAYDRYREQFYQRPATTSGCPRGSASRMLPKYAKRPAGRSPATTRTTTWTWR